MARLFLDFLGCGGSRVGCNSFILPETRPPAERTRPVANRRYKRIGLPIFPARPIRPRHQLGPGHRVLLRAVRRHRRPIEVVVEEPIPAGKVGVPVNSRQLVIISKMIGHTVRPFSEVETMQN